MRDSRSWQTFTTILFNLRTWARATIWGDRVSEILWPNQEKNPNGYQLFLQFYGPTTILLQTRASRTRDVLTSENVNEIADTQPGAVQPLVTLSQERGQADSGDPKAGFPVISKAPRMTTARIGTDGKVTFEPIGSKT